MDAQTSLQGRIPAFRHGCTTSAIATLCTRGEKSPTPARYRGAVTNSSGSTGTPLRRISKCRRGCRSGPLAHQRDRRAARDVLALRHEQLGVVAVGVRERLVVLDDDELAVADEPAAGVDDSARRRRAHGLTLAAADRDAGGDAAVGAEPRDESAVGRPRPAQRQRRWRRASSATVVRRGRVTGGRRARRCVERGGAVRVDVALRRRLARRARCVTRAPAAAAT